MKIIREIKNKAHKLVEIRTLNLNKDQEEILREAVEKVEELEQQGWRETLEVKTRFEKNVDVIVHQAVTQEETKKKTGWLRKRRHCETGRTAESGNRHSCDGR